MYYLKYFLLPLLLSLAVLATIAVIGCSSGDDDDDDDVDDDDDDDDEEPPCGDYDIVIDGETQTGKDEYIGWIASLVIGDDNSLNGIIDPDEEEPAPYEVIGLRTSYSNGYLDGSFDTPANLQPLCQEETTFAHLDFSIILELFEGDVSLYCGSVDDQNLIAVLRATGTVTCGNFNQ